MNKHTRRAAECLRRALPVFEKVHSDDRRIRQLIDKAHAGTMTAADRGLAQAALADAIDMSRTAFAAGNCQTEYAAQRVAEGAEHLVRTLWDPDAAEHVAACARDALARAADTGGYAGEMTAIYRCNLEREWQSKYPA